MPDLRSTSLVLVVCAALLPGGVGALALDDGGGTEPPRQPEQEKQEDPKAPPPGSLDELLGLDEEERPAERSAEDAARQEAEEALRRRLTREEVHGAIAEVVSKMSLSADLLDTSLDPGLGTQRLQEDVLAKLTQLIEEGRRQRSSSSSSDSSSSSRQQQQQQQQDPGRRQQQQQQQGESGACESLEGVPPAAQQEGDINQILEEGREEWGSLPDRVREMLVQGMRERFSSLYEQMTRDYYRRLAED